MTRKCLTDEQRGRLWNRFGAIVEKVEKESLPYSGVMDALQLIFDGEISHPLFKRDMRKESGWTLVEEGPQIPEEFRFSDFEPKGFLNHDEEYIMGEELCKRALNLNANWGQHHTQSISLTIKMKSLRS